MLCWVKLLVWGQHKNLFVMDDNAQNDPNPVVCPAVGENKWCKMRQHPRFVLGTFVALNCSLHLQAVQPPSVKGRVGMVRERLKLDISHLKKKYCRPVVHSKGAS